MEILTELIKSVRRLDDQDEQSHSDSAKSDMPRDDELTGSADYDLDGGEGEETPGDAIDGAVDDVDPLADEMNSVTDDEHPYDLDDVDGASDMLGDESDIDNVADAAVQDPNREGVLRTIKHAQLVYKRKNEDGGYEEMWAFNVGKGKRDFAIKKEILAGTDIPYGKTETEDGRQRYDSWCSGNVELVRIVGLPN